MRYRILGGATVVLLGVGALLLAEPDRDRPPASGAPAPAAAPENAKPADALLEFTRRPLAEVVRAVAERIGRPIVFRTEATGRVEVSMRLPGGDSEVLMKSFGRSLDRHNIALLRDPDPANGWYLVSFRRVPAVAPAPEDSEPFTVRVVEGRVRLHGDRGVLDLQAGEEGAITVAGQFLPMRRIDTRSVAQWRTGAAASSGYAAAPPADAQLTLACRVIGTTDDGQTIVEWQSPGKEPQKAILKKGEKELQLPVPVDALLPEKKMDSDLEIPDKRQ